MNDYFKVTKDLGTMNGWVNQPTEYTKHIADCGSEYTYKYMMGTPNKFRMETSRKYNMSITKRGSCYHHHYCHDCGIAYRIDSGGQGLTMNIVLFILFFMFVFWLIDGDDRI